MAIFTVVMAILAASSSVVVNGDLYRVGASFSNSPGLSCRTISVAAVYERPSLSSRKLGRTQNFIAVTGEELNGFVPMITGKRVRGWVEATETIIGAPGDLRGPCVVQMQPDGRLLFGWR